MTNLQKRLWLISIASFAMHCAQSQQSVLHGKIIDENSGNPLPSAFVITPSGKWIADQAGFFAVRIHPGDTALVSHVGYETQSFQPIVLADTIVVKLKQETIFLNTVVVRDYQTEEELKESILNNPVVESPEVINARNNLAKIRALYAMGYREQMNSYDRFRYHLKAPEGVKFFSSQGGGIIKALKDLSSKPNVRFKLMNNNQPKPAGMFFVKSNPSPDTVRSDTTAANKQNKP